MKKVIILALLFSIIATPSYALNIVEKFIYAEVQLGSERVLVNRVTGRVEKRSVGNRYEPIPSDKGWGGIPSTQDMYQAQYDKMRGG